MYSRHYASYMLCVMFVSHEHRARWCNCRVPVPAGFLAGCIPTAPISFESFLDTIISTICRPFSVRFTSSANFLVSTASGMRTVHSVEFPPLLCHMSCVCVSFFASLSFVRMVPGISNFWGYKVRSSENYSTCAFWPIRFVTRLGTESPHFAFNSRLLPYKFGSVLFFLVAGNLALFTSFPSSFCGLQVPVQPSTLQFSSYVRSVRARASDASHFCFSCII